MATFMLGRIMPHSVNKNVGFPKTGDESWTYYNYVVPGFIQWDDMTTILNQLGCDLILIRTVFSRASMIL